MFSLSAEKEFFYSYMEFSSNWRVPSPGFEIIAIVITAWILVSF